MAEGLLTSRVGAAARSADQAFFGLSNLVVIFAIAVVSVTRDFSRLALLLTLLAAASGVVRGALGTPLLQMAGRDRADLDREASFAVTSVLLASPVIAGAMWAITGSATGWPAILIMVATPIVLVEDVLRYVAVARGRPRLAAFWDGVWFAGSVALLVTTWLHLSFATTTFLIAGWTVLAFLALVGMLIAVRVGPLLGNYPAWISEDWKQRAWYAMGSGLEQTLLFVVLLFCTVFLSPEIAGTLRGATALLAPVAVVAGAIPLVDIAGASPRRVWKLSARPAGITSSAMILVGVASFLVPIGVGKFVLGHTFEDVQAIMPIVAVDYAIAAWIVAVTIYLRTFGRSAEEGVLRLSYAGVVLATAFGGALLYPTAAGVSVGIATATTFIAAVVLLRFRPWATPARTSSPRPTATVAVRDVLKVGARRPMPLATTLRLHEPNQTNEALITLWAFAVLAVFIPAAIIRYTSLPVNMSWLWSLPAIALCAARLSWLLGSGERRLFETIFWVYSYLFMGLTPLTQLRENVSPITVPRVDTTFVVAASLMVIIGCVAFLAGAGLDHATAAQPRRGAGPGAGGAKAQLFTINYPRVVVLCVFAILVNFYYLAHVGWLIFLMSRYESQANYDAVWPRGSIGIVVLPCTLMALLVAFIALLRFRKEAKRASESGEYVSTTVMRSSMALLIVIGLLAANSLNPLSSARYLSGTALLAAAAAFGLFATRRRFRLAISGLLAGMLVIFPLADAFRVTRQGELKATNPIESLLSGDYDSFAQLMNGYLVGAREGIVPGKQFSAVLFFWVRRAIWPGKPVDTGTYIADMRGYGFGNLSAPLWIELYLNGGWVLLAVGMFALGYGLHRWDTRLNAQLGVDRIPRLLECILPFYMLILLRGSLLQATSYLFFIVAFSLFVRQRKPAKIRPGPPGAAPELPQAPDVEQRGPTYAVA